MGHHYITSKYQEDRVYILQVENKIIVDVSIDALDAIQHYVSEIKQLKEMLLRLRNTVTNDYLTPEIEREKHRIKREKRSLKRRIEEYIRALDELEINYRRYITSDKTLKINDVYKVAKGVLNDSIR
jgi:FtsZ-binding cell division protein ZapB